MGALVVLISVAMGFSYGASASEKAMTSTLTTLLHASMNMNKEEGEN